MSEGREIPTYLDLGGTVLHTKERLDRFALPPSEGGLKRVRHVAAAFPLLWVLAGMFEKSGAVFFFFVLENTLSPVGGGITAVDLFCPQGSV